MSVPPHRRLSCIALGAVLALGLALAGPVHTARAADDLPPEVRFDVLKLELDKAIAAGRHGEILALIGQLRKTGLPLDPELGYIEARERYATGAVAEARTALVAYLKTVGRRGKHYGDAIRLYVRIKDELDKQAAEAHRRQAEAAAKRLAEERAAKARLARIQQEREKQAALAKQRAEKERLARLERARAEKRRRAAARRKARHRAEVMAALSAARTEIAGREARRNRWKDRVSTLGGRGDDMVRVLARAEAGGFVLGGSFSQSRDTKRHRKAGAVPWLGRIDAEGRLVWQRVLGTAAKQGVIRSIATLPDGGFVIGGLRDGFRFIARTDSRGTPLINHRGQPWLIVFGRNRGDTGNLVRLGAGPTIYAIGLETGKDGKPVTPSRLFVLRFSALGKTLGRAVVKRTPDANIRALTDALVLPGGDVVASGALVPEAGDNGVERGVLMRLTSKGEVAWEYRLAAAAGASGSGVRLTALARGPDGRLYAAGRDGNAMLALAFSAEGKTLWRKRIPGSTGASERARALCALDDWKAVAANADNADKDGITPVEASTVETFACKGQGIGASATALVARDDGVVMLGIQGRDGAGTNGDIRAVALDSAGKVLWDRLYGHDGFDLPTSGLATADGGIVVAGATDSVGAGGRDFMMFKLDKTGAFAPWTALAPPPWAAPRIEARRTPDEGTGPRQRRGGAGGREGKPATAAAGSLPKSPPARTGASAAGKPTARRQESSEPPSTTLQELFDGVFGSSDSRK